MRINKSGRAGFCDVLRTLSRHRKKMAACFALILAAAWTWMWIAPRTYVSTAKLYMRMGREHVTLDPTATTGQTVNLYQTRDSEINSALHILESQGIAEQVVDEIGAANILSDSLNRAEVSPEPEPTSIIAGELDRLMQRAKVLLPQVVESDRSRALRTLLSRMTIWSPVNSNVIAVECRAGDPRLAQQIVSAWTTIFLREDLRLTRTQGTYEFFSREVARQKELLEDAERELREAKTAAGLVSIAGQQKILEDQAGAIRSQRVLNNAALQSAKAKIVDLQEQLKTLPASIVIEDTSGVPHFAWDRMRELLYELQIREEELGSRFTDRHPVLKAVQSQREEVAKVLDTEPDARKQSTTGPNPTHHTALQSLLLEKATVASLSAASEALQRQHELLQQEFEAMNDWAARIADLERRVAILDGVYRNQADKLEQARIHQALDHDGISSVNVLQPATFVERPASPNKLLILAVGLMAAIGCSLVLAFTAEYLDNSLTTSAQVEESLDLPVLVAIPRTTARALAVR
jgi:uncharacterized protein involved in exopolysaccharide biosynthesis